MIASLSRNRFLLAGLAAFGLAAAAAPAPAVAFNWRISPENSEIRFSYTEDGDPAVGRFTQFSGVAEFDPRRPGVARLDLKIEIDSIALSDGFRSDFVQTETWFNEERFPTASFRLTRLIPEEPVDAAPLEAGARRVLRYRAEGELTIKGETRPTATPFTLVLENGGARATGALRFNRFDFHVGDKIGGLFVEIGEDVAVEFDLAAQKL